MIQTPVQPQPDYEPELRDKKLPFWIFLLLLGIVAGVIFNMAKEKPFYQIDENGNVILAPWRQKQKEKTLQRMQDSEQYALIAGQSGWYPCYKCPDTAVIFLLPEEVWKYGATTKHEKGRYTQGLPDPRLVYVIQFEGTFQECKELELIKIYDYPLLPENMKRKPPIMLPPGNFRSD